MKKLFIVFVLAFLSGGSAFAQYGKGGQVELSPYFGVIFPDSYGPVNPNEAPLAGLRLGYFFSKSVSGELSAQRGFSETGSGVTNSNVNLDGYRFNLLWNIQTHSMVVPFIAGGIGYERFDSNATGAEYDLGYNAGVGLRFFAGENAGLRLETRYATSNVNTGTENWEWNWEGALGMFFLFGKHAKVAPAPVAVAPKDADADTVMDDVDQCPGTPAGSTVDAKGCVVVNDDDKDGVGNTDDKCPATPENAPVDQTGCPLDSDSDNVKDYMDKCPNTPAGVQVDEMGCPLQSKARGVLNGVTFKSGSPVLTDNAMTVLNGVAVALRDFPEVKVEVQGHSDATGNDAINLSLSQKRAESVMNYLVSQGVPAAQLTAKGYGKSMPIADNKTPAGRAKNRRVELKWLD